MKRISEFLCGVFGHIIPPRSPSVSNARCLRCEAKVWLSALAFLLVAGCGSNQFAPDIQRTPVIVENRNFYDARVRLDGRRIGTVSGITTDTLYVGITGHSVDVLVELIGGAGSLFLGTFGLDSRELYIQIHYQLVLSQAWVQ